MCFWCWHSSALCYLKIYRLFLTACGYLCGPEKIRASIHKKWREMLLTSYKRAAAMWGLLHKCAFGADTPAQIAASPCWPIRKLDTWPLDQVGIRPGILFLTTCRLEWIPQHLIELTDVHPGIQTIVLFWMHYWWRKKVFLSSQGWQTEFIHLMNQLCICANNVMIAIFKPTVLPWYSHFISNSSP